MMEPRAKKFIRECFRSLGESGGASARGILNGFMDTLDGSLAAGGIAANILPNDLEHVFSLQPVGISPGRAERLTSRMLSYVGADLSAAASSKNRFNSHSVFFAASPLTALMSRGLVRLGSGLPVADSVSVDIPDGAGRLWLFTALLSKRHTPTPEQHKSWNAAAPHLSSVLRLLRQMQLCEPEAIFSQRGGVQHVGTQMVERHLPKLRAAAARADENGGLWPEVVAGRWSLVQGRDTDGSLFVKAYRNCRGVVDSRALSAAEREVLPHVVLGKLNTTIALELGVSEATISRCVENLLLRLGCTREAVPLYVRALDGTPIPIAPAIQFHLDLKGPPTWSTAEREVACGALSGMSIAEIAQERGRSEITVRKQLRSAVRKAGGVDRLDLAVSLDASIR
jgi:DNA-binding NarL/FixJ family response regulator